MSDILTRLIEAGTPAGLVAEVARELARAEVAQEAINQRRERDRERQSRRRGNVTSRDNADVTSNPPLSLSPNEKISNPHTHTPVVYTPRARKAEPFPMPEGTDPDHWRDFLANRKRKNLPNTPTAHKRLIADLNRLADDDWPPGKLIEHAAAKGWAGIYDPRTDETRNGTPQQSYSKPGVRGSRPNPLIDLYRDACAAVEAEGASGHHEDDSGTWLALPPIGAG